MATSKIPTSINVLKINIRTRNALKRSGIYYIEDLRKKSEDDLLEIYGIGMKSFDELKEAFNKYMTTFENGFAELDSEEHVLFQTDEKPPIFLKYIDLRYLEIDPDLLYRLNSANIFNLFDVFLAQKNEDWTKSDLLSEISNKLKNLKDGKLLLRAGAKERKIVNSTISKLLEEFQLIDPIQLTRAVESSLAEYKSEGMILEEDSFLSSLQFQDLLNSDLMISSIDSKIVDKIRQSEDGVTNISLLDMIPNWLPTNILRTAILRAEGQKIIRKNFIDKWVVYKVSLEEYLQSISYQRDREILVFRLQGETLEEIASRINVTRERVRQIEARNLDTKPPILEDEYLSYYQVYAFTKEEFCDIFDVASEVYGYMILTTKTKGKRPIEKLLEDQSIPGNIRKNLIDVMRRDSIIVENSRIPKKPRSIIDYLVKQNVHKKFSIEEFYEIYNNFLNEHVVTDPELNLSFRAFEGILYRNSNVFSTHGKTFVVLDVESIDIEEFVEDLELNKLKNVEISSLKLFQQYPEIMEMYKIDDQFILHNLLKKLHLKHNLGNIKFLRMPVIKFGVGNRHDQVMELLRQNSPISQEDLADLYYQRYGIERNTFIAGFLNDFQKYYSNGSYDIMQKPLSQEQQDYLTSKLVKDYYSIEKVKGLFEEKFHLPAEEFFNKKTLSSLGYILNDKGIVRKEYRSLKGYLEKRIFSNGFVHIDDLDFDLANSMSFRSYLYALTSDDLFFEFLPKHYVSKERLEDFYIDEVYIDNFRKEAFEWDTSSPYFTIASLKNTGFTLPTHPSRFGNYFFSSLLLNDKVHFSWFRFGRNRVFCKGQVEPNANSFFADLLKKLGDINVDALVEHLQDTYEISVDRYKILQNIASAELFYDPESQMIRSSSIGSVAD